MELVGCGKRFVVEEESAWVVVVVVVVERGDARAGGFSSLVTYVRDHRSVAELSLDAP